MKHTLTHSDPAIQQKAFTYYVKDYDSKKKVYILHNPVTKDIKIMDKEQFEQMHAEQHPVHKDDPVNSGKPVDIPHNH